MGKGNKICLGIIIGFSILGIMGSGVMFFIDIPQSIISIITAWTGIVGTIASVLLSIIAMVYSNKSSKAAEESLEKITEQYRALCDEITLRAISSNLGRNSVENIIRKEQKIIKE